MKHIALLLAFAVVSASALSQNAVSSALNLGAQVDADYYDANAPAQGIYSFTQGATLATLSGSASALDVSGANSASADSKATATWSSSAAGNVSVSGGWAYNTTVTGAGYLNNSVTGLQVWRYTFTATSDANLTLNWAVVGNGNTFGLQGWVFDFDGLGGGEFLATNAAYPDGSGSLTRSLINGQTYTIGLSNYANVSGGVGGLGASSYDGRFDWDIQPVPEPFSMSALALGFAAVARRRRK